MYGVFSCCSLAVWAADLKRVSPKATKSAGGVGVGAVVAEVVLGGVGDVEAVLTEVDVELVVGEKLAGGGGGGEDSQVLKAGSHLVISPQTFAKITKGVHCLGLLGVPPEDAWWDIIRRSR